MMDQKPTRRFLIANRVELRDWVRDTFGLDADAVTNLTIDITAGGVVTVTAVLFADERLTELAFPEMTEAPE